MQERESHSRAVSESCAPMPRYHFPVRNHDHLEDEDGAFLPDNQTARAHAMQIIHELQKGDEETWSGCTMDVVRDGELLWRIPFEVSDPPS
jgi:hypothetical protein